MTEDPAAAAGRALDLVLPPRCPFCGDVVSPGDVVHVSCVRRLPRIRGPRCRICGKPVLSGDAVCDDCAGGGHSFSSGTGIFLYEGKIREVMNGFKFRGRRADGRALGFLLAEGGMPYIARWKPDFLLPVPAHPEKVKQRGYNQAADLAEIVAKRSGLPLRDDLLIRLRATGAMKELGTEERRRNLEEAFRLVKPPDKGSVVLVIDDIYTTGATIDALSAILLSAGAARVHFLTVCIGGGFMVSY